MTSPQELFNEGLAIRLRQARKDAGFKSRDAAAAATGIPAATIKLYESGDSDVPAHRLCVFAETYAVSLAELCGMPALPARRMVVDMGLRALLRGARSSAELEELLTKSEGVLGFQIPDQPELLTVEEFDAFKQEIQEKRERLGRRGNRG